MLVHRMGYGAMRLTGANAWGEPDDYANSLAVLRRAVELGIDFIDTAEVYGPYLNESQIADALHPYPQSLVIATKCGISRPQWDVVIPDGRPESIRIAIEGSLKRLKRETIDLYQLHRIDRNIPLADTLGALNALRLEGKVRHVGLSEASVEDLEAARAIMPIATVQNRYSLLDREHEPVLNACTAAGIGFIPWAPLAGGNTASARQAVIKQVAAKHAALPSQVALAWLLAKSPAILVIPGTSSILHLEENICGALLRLDDKDMEVLEAVAMP